MKLKSIILIAALFSTNIAQALSLEVLAGNRFDSATFVSTNPLVTSMNASITSSYQGGALLGVTLAGPLDVNLGLLYKTRTTNITATIFGTSSGLTSKDTVYDIPLRLRFNLPMGVYLNVGATYSSVQSTNCSAAFGNMSCSTNTGRTSDDVLAVAGLGYKFIKVTKFSLALEGNYDYGLRDMGSGSGVSGWARGIEANLVAGFSL